MSYDGNGNIKKYNRFFDATSGPMDSLTYVYTAGTNRLTQVKDSSGNAINALKKIKNQVANNYAYDEIGNLIKDSSEYISTGGIKWNVYGKITEINHYQQEALVSTKKISYTYDAAGNRIGKKVVKFGSPTVSYTWYVRDARGNVMQVYTASGDTTAADTTDAARLSRLSTANLVLAESHIYGSSRLGFLNQYVPAESRSGGGVVYESRGYKFYEIANHLGNVLGVITDKKMAHTSNGINVDYYNPDIVNVADYYPFGMPSRSAYLGTVSLNYRYTFNGKENDADVKGDGDQIDYGMRIYDPRLGRFLSLDPLHKSYPWYSPYQYAGNMPTTSVDIDGMEPAEQKNENEKAKSKDQNIKSLLDKLDDKLTGQSGKNEEKIQILRAGIKNQAEEVNKTKALKGQAFTQMLNSKLGSPELKASLELYKKYDVEEESHTKALVFMIGELYKADRHDENIKKYNEFVNKELDLALYSANTMATVASFIPTGGASAGLFATSTEIRSSLFSLRGGYGVFGQSGLKVGGYKIEAMYAGEAVGTGTIFSIKQVGRTGGNLVRWDYGLIHGTQELGLHSTFRLNAFGKTFGSTAQRAWYAPFKFWKYPR